MPYMSRIAGGSATFTTRGVAGPVTLKTLLQGGPWPAVASKAVTIRNPGAGAVSNTTNVKIGPDGTAGFELIPGGVTTLENVIAGDVGIDDLGTQVTLYIAWGGEPA